MSLRDRFSRRRVRGSFRRSQSLQARGFLKDPRQLAVSGQAHVILDVHKRIDRAREQHLPRKIGTTGRGIGPAYEEKNEAWVSAMPFG